MLEFREQHPTTRLRKLDSVRRNHVRCYDEDTLLAQRAPITDVIESGAVVDFDPDRVQIVTPTDFELPDYWDEGEVLAGREKWPICVTLNLVCTEPQIYANLVIYL